MNSSTDKIRYGYITQICPIIAITFIIFSIVCYYFSLIKHASLPLIIINYLCAMTLSDWKDIATIFYGAIGLMPGYRYFDKRVIIDRKEAKDERARKRISYIYDELNNADKVTDLILNREVKNDDDLQKARAKLDKIFILITTYLDSNNSLLGFDSDELEIILTVHSFIIHSDIIFKIKYSDLSAEKIEYMNVIQEARTICIQKIETL